MNIGTHIPKSKAFLSSLQSYFEKKEINKTKPVQIFSGSPKFWRRPRLDEVDAGATKKYIDTHQLTVFVHSIYLINVCQPPTDFKKKAHACLLWELETGKRLGFKGVVVHCGKSLKMDLSIALQHMYTNLHQLLPFVDPACPLLLETSSGQGSEMCWKLEDFIAFYHRFTLEERSKIKICVDTCHVFAAGHDPVEFILQCAQQFPTSIVIVHFNDSKEEKGEKKDRHERPGKGKIGLTKMTEVARWCFAQAIPMIME